MAKTVKKTKTSKTNTKSSVKNSNKTTKKSKRTPAYLANSVEELGLNKIQAKTITTLFTKEKSGVLSISRITGIPRRKVMRTLEIQNLKSFSAGSYK